MIPEPARSADGGLLVRTVAVPDPGDLISRLPQPDALAWVRRGEGLAGWGEAARVTLPPGADRFAAAEKWFQSLIETAHVEDQVGVPGTGPVAFGSFTFDAASEGSVLVLPRAVLGRRDGQCWLTTITPDGAAPHVAPADGAPAGPAGQYSAASPVPAPGQVRWHDGSLSAPGWQQAVAAAVAAIRAGRLRKAVLARDLYATTAQPPDVRLLLRRLATRYPDCYTFCCAGMVGATPELLVRRRAARVDALVLAGTAARGAAEAADRALGAALLSSAKDQEEHAYAATGMRETLGPLCERLVTDPAPSLLRLANVQHLATSVTGTLAPDAHGRVPSALAVAARLHPTPAVCGTPAEAAMELIRELEGMDRGRYAGPVGWLDADGTGEWGIALRCAELDGDRTRLFAGCGIVAGSDPAAELAEAQAKFRPVQDAIEDRNP